jgi:hypothetical protein
MARLFEICSPKLPVEVFIHLYKKGSFEVAEHKDIEETKRWLRSEPESLAFSEVWEDLLTVVRKQQEFVTLDAGKRFAVRHTVTPADGLIFQDGEELFAPQDALLDAWQHLRSVGFLTVEGLTQGLDMHADKVMALLATLPYLKPAKIAAKRAMQGNEFSTAIQFIPRPAKEQITLRPPPELVRA